MKAYKHSKYIMAQRILRKTSRLGLFKLANQSTFFAMKKKHNFSLCLDLTSFSLGYPKRCSCTYSFQYAIFLKEKEQVEN